MCPYSFYSTAFSISLDIKQPTAANYDSSKHENTGVKPFKRKAAHEISPRKLQRSDSEESVISIYMKHGY